MERPFSSDSQRLCFTRSGSEKLCFYCNQHVIYFLVYVEDIIMAGPDIVKIRSFERKIAEMV